jgi:hypothetical protein
MGLEEYVKLEELLRTIGKFPDTVPPPGVTTWESAIYDWATEATRVIIQTRQLSDG